MKPLTEQQWTRHATDALDATGWRWTLTKPSKHGSNGAPDLLACRPPRVLAIELKRETWRGATDEQKAWLRDLNASGVEAVVVTLPREWHRFETLIERPPIQESFTTNSTGAHMRLVVNNEGTPNP